MSSRYDQLWLVKQNMEDDNKRLVESIALSESQLSQKAEEDKIITSQLRREISGKYFVEIYEYIVHISVVYSERCTHCAHILSCSYVNMCQAES